jgi:carbonic anhydrase/acetyltransferase-like protein (isoleucine patch superfamily)
MPLLKEVRGFVPKIGKGCYLADNATVIGTIVQPGSIWGGVPAKFIKNIEPEQTKEMIKKIADNYQMYAGWFMSEAED